MRFLTFIGCWYSKLFIGTFSNFICNHHYQQPISTTLYSVSYSPNDTTEPLTSTTTVSAANDLTSTTLKAATTTTTTTTTEEPSTTRKQVVQPTTRNPVNDWRKIEIAPIEYLTFAPFSNDGTRAYPNQFPFHVFLTFNEHEKTCSGAKVNRNTVATAATCLYDLRNKQLYDSASINIALIDKLARRSTLRINNLASKTLIHPQFNFSNFNYNVALIRLEGEGGVDNVIKLANKLPAPDQLLIATGFGKSTVNTNLKYHRLRATAQSECLVKYGPSVCSNSTFTAFRLTQDRGAMCTLDSGSPLFVVVHGRPLLVGLASFISKNGCLLGFPDGYVSIPHCYTWLKSNL